MAGKTGTCNFLRNNINMSNPLVTPRHVNRLHFAFTVKAFHFYLLYLKPEDHWPGAGKYAVIMDRYSVFSAQATWP